MKMATSIHSDVDDRVIGITLDELKKIDRVVGVTGGPQKEKVIRAALIGKLINVIITDQQSAKKLIRGLIINGSKRNHFFGKGKLSNRKQME